MNSITLSKLKNSVGKRLKFKTFCFIGNNYDKLEDIFTQHFFICLSNGDEIETETTLNDLLKLLNN